jgi:hypothetical protein
MRTTSRRRPLIESLESRLLFDVTVQIPAGQSVVFSAPDGTLCNLQFSNCAGSVTFTGNNLSQGSALNGTITLTGTTTTVTSIDVSNATTASSVTLRAKTPNQIPLGTFHSDGPLKNVTLKQMTLEGDLDAPGIAMLNLGSMQNAHLQYAGFMGSQPFTLIAGNVTDSTITSADPFKSVTLGSFLSSTPGTANSTGSSVLTSPGLWMLKVNGNMTADLNLTGTGGAYADDTLGRAFVSGDVTAGHWNVQGNSWYIGAHSFGSQWSGVNAGYVTSFKTAQDFSGNWTVGSVTSATIGRNMTGANVHFTYDYSPTSYSFKNWTIGNSYQLSYMYGPGNFGNFKSQFMGNGYVLSGVTTPSFDLNAPTVFSSPDARFDSMTIHCHSTMINFADSYAAAPNFGNLNLGMVQTPNGGIPFGIRAKNVIKQLKMNFKNHSINMTNVVNATSIQDALTAAGISASDAQDFVANFGG